MLAIKLKTAKVANLPPILSAKWTSHSTTVHVFQAICESVYNGTSFFRGFGTQDSSNYRGSTLLPLLVLLLVNKPTCEISDVSLYWQLSRARMIQVGQPAAFTCTMWALRSWLTIRPRSMRTSVMTFGVTSQKIDSYSMSWSCNHILKTCTVYARL